MIQFIQVRSTEAATHPGKSAWLNKNWPEYSINKQSQTFRRIVMPSSSQSQSQSFGTVLYSWTHESSASPLSEPKISLKLPRPIYKTKFEIYFTDVGLNDPWIESPSEARFSAPVHTGPGAYPASYTMGTGSFLGVKRPGRGVNHPAPCSAEVKERVELHFYTRFGPSWPVLERTLLMYAYTN